MKPGGVVSNVTAASLLLPRAPIRRATSRLSMSPVRLEPLASQTDDAPQRNRFVVMMMTPLAPRKP